MSVIEARSLRKSYGKSVALDGVDLRVEEGRILGLIGPNGAGKSTLLQAILGLVSYEGGLTVLGRNPWTERDRLMAEVCFIADVAVMPRWMKASQALDYLEGVHPRFDRAKAEGFLDRTNIRRDAKVRQLSKGMVAQLHLALVMAVDARLLVLDEPTLGLDLIYRKAFYDGLLNDYFDHSRTIIVSTHQVDEIQHILTDVAFLSQGRVVLDCAMEELESRFTEVTVAPDRLAAARALKPIHERAGLGRTSLIFRGVDRRSLAELGELRTPGLADLFIALAGGETRQEAAA
jgi:ABC-2 type transport system ATP-binding protein